MHARSAVAIDVAQRWADPPPAADAVVLGNLVQAYACFADAGDRDRIAALFTADATWDGTELGYGTALGPQPIAELICAHVDPEAPMMHLPGPALLATGDGGEVLGLTWCTALRWREGVARPVIYFSYDDVFRRDGSGVWRFSQRTLRAAAPK